MASLNNIHGNTGFVSTKCLGLLITMNITTFLDIANRFKENPLILPAEIKPGRADMTVEGLLNPAAFRFQKKVWMLVSVVERPVQKAGHISLPVLDEGEMSVVHCEQNDVQIDDKDPGKVLYRERVYSTTITHLRLLCSDDGRSFHAAEGYEPFFGIDQMEAHGISDCRVTEIDDLFYLSYVMSSSFGHGVGMSQTRDWKRYERRGMIFPHGNMGCAIFEEKIRGRYFALHHPAGPSPDGNFIWLAESPDLIHWGNHKCIATSRKNMWDCNGVRASASPIRTPGGWLVIYHGADREYRYCLGALLLDTRDFGRVIARSESPFMEPSEAYEMNGTSASSIFSNGYLVVGDKILLYYGSSEGAVCGAELSIDEILKSLSSKKNAAGLSLEEVSSN